MLVGSKALKHRSTAYISTSKISEKLEELAVGSSNSESFPLVMTRLLATSSMSSIWSLPLCFWLDGSFPDHRIGFD